MVMAERLGIQLPRALGGALKMQTILRATRSTAMPGWAAGGCKYWRFAASGRRIQPILNDTTPPAPIRALKPQSVVVGCFSADKMADNCGTKPHLRAMLIARLSFIAGEIATRRASAQLAQVPRQLQMGQRLRGQLPSDHVYVGTADQQSGRRESRVR